MKLQEVCCRLHTHEDTSWLQQPWVWATLTDMFAEAVRESQDSLQQTFSLPVHSRLLVCKLRQKNGIIFLELPVLT